MSRSTICGNRRTARRLSSTRRFCQPRRVRNASGSVMSLTWSSSSTTTSTTAAFRSIRSASRSCTSGRIRRSSRTIGLAPSADEVMLANSASLAAILVLALLFVVADQLRFLAPYRSLILDRYLTVIAAALGVTYANVFACIYVVTRRLFLKDTGRKLAHLEKQLRAGDTIVRDLSERLDEED